MCAFYWQLEFCITLFGLVDLITLLFVTSECFVCSFSSLDLLFCAVVVVSLVGHLLSWNTWMRQREQPDGECKRKKRAMALNRDSTAVSVESSVPAAGTHTLVDSPPSHSGSSVSDRSSVTAVLSSPLFGCNTSLTVSLVSSDSNPLIFLVLLWFCLAVRVIVR